LFLGDTDSLPFLRGDLNSESKVRRWYALPGHEVR